MLRRQFISLVGSAAATPLAFCPRSASAQQVRRVGVLMPLTKDDPEDQARAAAFVDGLKALGWAEGRNLHLEFRSYAGESTRARVMARELIDARAEVIMVAATPGAVALWQETRTVPIVFVTVTDPVGLGLAGSLARPGGNATGYTFFEFSVGGKLLELLKQAAVGVRRAAVLYNPQTTAYALYLNSLQSAASSLGVEIVPSPVRDPAEIEATLAAIAREANSGVICLPDTYLNVHRRLIVGLAARHKLPAIYSTRLFADDGGLLSYGVDTLDLYRRAALYVDRILKGAHPGELPIQQPTRYEMILNLKAAKALGLNVPLAMQVTADEVIE